MWMIKTYEKILFCACMVISGTAFTPESIEPVDIVVDEIVEEVFVIDEKELNCLQKNIYFEARNQGAAGMKAVAAVTLNRVDDPRFPQSICSVVYQPRQFSWANRGDREPRLRNSIERDAWEKAGSIARKAMLGVMTHEVDKAQYFHTTWVKPRWPRNMELVAVVGDHMFWYQPL